jgi:DNA polymerase I
VGSAASTQGRCPADSCALAAIGGGRTRRNRRGADLGRPCRVTARIGPAQVRDRYGVNPDQVPDFIALRGDPSDKLPGARGVGPKGAADLLKRYGSLDSILAAGLFPAQAEDLRLFRSIATMNRKAPLPSLAAQKPRWSKAADLARTWASTSLPTG